MTDSKCSRAGCQASASHLISWRNPKVHVEGRVKTWAACDAHREFLINYLSARDFFLKDEPFDTKHS
ncbi:MAG: acetone carboxylase [Aquiluna sp.]|nr:acetone carboxylase [Aquiluna sp.]